ncbi:MAG TPA: class I SAM-dependent methyltransferase [Streptosporangiaceae bacterium]
MNVTDAVAFAGHQVHVCRWREAGTLLRWLGPDLHGLRVLDVAGGDGYWAGQARRRGADAVAIDIAGPKLRRGAQLAHAPALVLGDALRLPFPDGSFDRVMSICAIEHFDDGPQALSEMARVLAPGGELVMSADTLSRADQWPDLFRAHCQRYHVKRTYTHGELTELLAGRGLDVAEYAYQFRSGWSERLYLTLSAHGGKVGFNAAAPLAPLVAAADRATRRDQGAIVLIRARRRPDGGPVNSAVNSAAPTVGEAVTR